MKEQKKQLWVILIIVFLGFIGISIPYLIFPALFLNPAYSIFPPDWTQSTLALLLGATLAAYPLGQFIGSPILGSFSDHYGRKPLLSGSLFLASLCYALTGIAITYHELNLLILSRFFAGVMEGNVAVARAMAVDLTSLSKHKTLGQLNACISIAFLVGPLFGGLLTDKTLFTNCSAATPFYLIGLLFLLIGGLSMLVLTPSHQPSLRTERVPFFTKLTTLLANKRLRFLLITSTLLTLAVDIFYEFAPVYLTVKWNLGPSQLVLYNTALCIALAIGNGSLPDPISKKIQPKLAVIASISLFSAALLAILFANTPWLMAALFALCGIAIGLSVTLLTVKISDSASPAVQGEVMGVQLSLRVLGDALICLFGGGLLIFSPKPILILASLISLTTLIYYSRFNRK